VVVRRKTEVDIPSPFMVPGEHPTGGPWKYTATKVFDPMKEGFVEKRTTLFSVTYAVSFTHCRTNAVENDLGKLCEDEDHGICCRVHCALSEGLNAFRSPLICKLRHRKRKGTKKQLMGTARPAILGRSLRTSSLSLSQMIEGLLTLQG